MFRVLVLSATVFASIAGLSTATAQQLAPRKAVTVPASVTEQDQEDFYRARRRALREHLPRIVFVPGILGSSIEECQPDASQCRLIWGSIDTLTDSSIDLTYRNDRAYRTDVVEELIFTEVYGPFLQRLRERSKPLMIDGHEDPLVTVFPYDWRRSNAVSARALAEVLCKVAAAAPDSPIAAIGHSMGGIVLKAWAMDHAGKPCPTGIQPRVSQLIFVATPHLGSPKTVRIFTDGYTGISDEVGAAKMLAMRVLGRLAATIVFPTLNKAGVSFPSTYELLPIATSAMCRERVPELRALAEEIYESADSNLNLYDPVLWKTLDLLARFGENGLRSSFYSDSLPRLLRDAERLQCNLAAFDPATVADKVTYVVARDADKVTLNVVLNSSPSGTQPVVDYTNGPGDGTVPVYSAENRLVSDSREVVEENADHILAINSPKLSRLIDNLYETAVRKAAVETSSASLAFERLTIAESAASGKLIPIPVNVDEWSEPSVRAAGQLNTMAIAEMGYSPTNVASVAATAGDPLLQAQLFAVAATSSLDSADRLLWTKDMAVAAYRSEDYASAIAGSERIIESADFIPGNQLFDVRDIAESVAFWSRLRSGDTSGLSFDGIAVPSEPALHLDPDAPWQFKAFDPSATSGFLGNQ